METEQVVPDTVAWGADTEYGRLTDVLVCPPDHYRWLPTSAISQATLDSDLRFDADLAARQHADMVACYEQAGVRTHFLTPDPTLPYQVFTRDSSTSTPSGVIVLQPQQSWRRGEYAAVAEFLRTAGVPNAGTITAGSIEGGDVSLIEPGCVLIGCSEGRTHEPGARQLAEHFEREGWETRIQPFPVRYVHLDVIVCSLAEKLVAACTEVIPAGLIRWLQAKGMDIIDVPEPEAFALGVNAMPLGRECVLSAAEASSVNTGLRSRGITVLEPELSMFTAGGGGPHCLGQALSRE